jgi:hypothetical protein
MNYVGVIAELISWHESNSEQDRQLLSGCPPVPFFGKLDVAEVATVAINPSALEFFDDNGDELSGDYRRLPTQASLGLASWGDANYYDLKSIEYHCLHYFEKRPYERWFNRLEILNEWLGVTYYSTLLASTESSRMACHLDLVPFATAQKWAEIPQRVRKLLLEEHSKWLSRVIPESNIKVLVLNGRTVVEAFCSASNTELTEHHIPGADLKRTNGASVKGIGYAGVISECFGVRLNHPIHIIGYNHNLQSSYGISRETILALAKWMSQILE